MHLGYAGFFRRWIWCQCQFPATVGDLFTFGERMKASRKKVGDQVRLRRVPPAVRRSWSKSPDTFLLFKRAVGRRFTVRGFDRYGHVELWLRGDGAEDTSGAAHSIWVEPEHLA